MSIKSTPPGLIGGRPALRSVFRTPAPDTLARVLLVVIAMVCAWLAGLALGTL